MPTNYPTSLDAFTNPTGTDPLTSPSHADQHTNINDAVEAIEAASGLQGSSFPGSPTTNQRFYRTDLHLMFFYDGTRWLSEQVFTIPLHNDGVALSANTFIRGNIPYPGSGFGNSGFYYTNFVLTINVAATHDASNFWTIDLYNESAGAIFTGLTSWQIVAAAGSYGATAQAVNVLSGTTAAATFVSARCLKSGSPGTLTIRAAAYGRIVAT